MNLDFEENGEIKEEDILWQLFEAMEIEGLESMHFVEGMEGSWQL